MIDEIWIQISFGGLRIQVKTRFIDEKLFNGCSEFEFLTDIQNLNFQRNFRQKT